MENTTSTDLNKILQELSESNFKYQRQNAAIVLGKLTMSNAAVVRALATAVALDSDADVRSAALQALQSPVHQAFLMDRPDFIHEATKLALEKQAAEKQKDEEMIKAEYLRRRTRVRVYYTIFLGGLIASCVLFLIGLTQGWLNQSMICGWQILVIVFVLTVYYMTWRNWRCPSCDAWLSGFGFHVNPILSSDFVRCPRCGKRLL
jgi:hypothetical protein